MALTQDPSKLPLSIRNILSGTAPPSRPVYDPYNLFGDNIYDYSGPSISSVTEIPGWKPSIVPPSIAPPPLGTGSILSPSPGMAINPAPFAWLLLGLA